MKKACFGNGSKANTYFPITGLILTKLKSPVHSETLFDKKLLDRRVIWTVLNVILLFGGGQGGVRKDGIVKDKQNKKVRKLKIQLNVM